MIPRWTTPSWTYSGMSLGRTSRRSTGAFAHGTRSERSVVSKASPASAQRRSAGSAIRPLAGTASVSRPFSPARVNGAHRRAFRLTRSSATPVAAGPVLEPLRDARHRRGGGGHALGDLEVGHALVEQQDRLPAVRQRLELGQRAEVAQEALHLVGGAQRQDRRRELVEPGDRLDVVVGGASLGWRLCSRHRHMHDSMLAC